MVTLSEPLKVITVSVEVSMFGSPGFNSFAMWTDSSTISSAGGSKVSEYSFEKVRRIFVPEAAA